MSVDGPAERRSLLPPPVTAGAKVAVIAPAGPVRDPARLEANLAALRSWGLHPVVLHEPERAAVAKPNSGHEASGAMGGEKVASFLAGKFNCSVPDAGRADALMAAFADDEFAAVVCAKGGYGTMRLLQLLDWSQLADQLPQKRLFGFSDITALHNACTAELRRRHVDRPWLVCFSSPMPETGLWGTSDPDDLARLQTALFAPTLPHPPSRPTHRSPPFGR